MTDPDKKKKLKKVVLILSIIMTVLMFVGFLWILRTENGITPVEKILEVIVVIAISFGVFYGIGTLTVNVVG